MDRGRRAMPVGNKACHARHLKKCQDNHRQRLANIKSTLDNKAPKTSRNNHLKSNAKKQQIMEDRYAQIERDNRILLEKMSSIMRSKTKQFDTSHTSSKFARSLNSESRKRDLQKITKENQRILNAIQRSEPFYNHIKWEEDSRKHNQYLKNICEYPVTLFDSKRGGEMEESMTQEGWCNVKEPAHSSLLHV
ncbi:unnamed protein product [Chrysoparadoxa australica]